jgi:hypothetical protein
MANTNLDINPTELLSEINTKIQCIELDVGNIKKVISIYKGQLQDVPVEKRKKVRNDDVIEIVRRNEFNKADKDSYEVDSPVEVAYRQRRLSYDSDSDDEELAIQRRNRKLNQEKERLDREDKYGNKCVKKKITCKRDAYWSSKPELCGCQKCDPLSEQNSNNDDCTCVGNAELVSGKCACKSGYKANNNMNGCIIDNTICSNGTGSKDACTACSSGYTLSSNGSIKTCVKNTHT